MVSAGMTLIFVPPPTPPVTLLLGLGTPRCSLYLEEVLGPVLNKKLCKHAIE